MIHSLTLNRLPKTSILKHKSVMGSFCLRTQADIFKCISAASFALVSSLLNSAAKLSQFDTNVFTTSNHKCVALFIRLYSTSAEHLISIVCPFTLFVSCSKRRDIVSARSNSTIVSVISFTRNRCPSICFTAYVIGFACVFSCTPQHFLLIVRSVRIARI